MDIASIPLTINGIVIPGLLLGLLVHCTTVIKNQIKTTENCANNSCIELLSFFIDDHFSDAQNTYFF